MGSIGAAGGICVGVVQAASHRINVIRRCLLNSSPTAGDTKIMELQHAQRWGHNTLIDKVTYLRNSDSICRSLDLHPQAYPIANAVNPPVEVGAQDRRSLQGCQNPRVGQFAIVSCFN